MRAKKGAQISEREELSTRIIILAFWVHEYRLNTLGKTSKSLLQLDVKALKLMCNVHLNGKLKPD